MDYTLDDTHDSGDDVRSEMMRRMDFAPPRPPVINTWPPSLAIDMALNLYDPNDLMARYGVDEHELRTWLASDSFQKALAEARAAMSDSDKRFKAKAAALAEEALETTFKMIHTAEMPPAVRAGLIRDLVGWAGLDAKAQQAAAAAQAHAGVAGVMINIVLPDGTPAITSGRTIEHEG